MKGIQIWGTGRALPARCVTNEEMEHFVDTSDEWIRTRTGIQNRYFVETEQNCDLAARAARQALEDASRQQGIPVPELSEKVGLVLVATFTADHAMPSVACMVQQKLQIPHAGAFDLNAACSGFVYGMTVAASMLQNMEEGKLVLLIGSEVISRTLDMTDRNTCILFGDGAGAVLLARGGGQFDALLGSDGNCEILHCGGVHDPSEKMQMEGRKVFVFAVDKIAASVRELLERNHLQKEDIAYYVFHQANARIIAHVQRKMGLPEERFYQNVSHYGNTSAASIPIALDEMNRNGLLRPGMRILCVGFGGGLTWAAVLLEWNCKEREDKTC